MKKYLISFALLIFELICVAQSTFTQATWREMSGDYKKDSNAFFINRLSDDFRYSNSNGKFIHKKDVAAAGTTAVLKASDAQMILTSLQSIQRMLGIALRNEILEPVIIQSCDLAIVSGIQKGLDDEKLACTYTFRKGKGKWIFVASHQTSLVE